MIFLSQYASQSTFTCSKLTIEILEQGVKYVHALNIDVGLISLVLTLNIFNTLF